MKNWNYAAMGLLVSLSASISSATTYRSIVPLGLPGNEHQYGPSMSGYPTIIEVIDAKQSVVDVNVSLLGYAHTRSSEMSFLLVSPSGVKVNIARGIGPGPGYEVDVTFDDEASEYATGGLGTTGPYTYKPTGYPDDGVFYVPPLWPYEASSPPAGPTYITLSAMDGTAANGSWRLYAFDDTYDDGGALQDGWSIDLESANVPEPTMMFTPIALLLFSRRQLPYVAGS